MEAAIASRSMPMPAGRHVRPAGFALALAGALLTALPASPVAGRNAVTVRTDSAGPQWVGADDERAASYLIELLESSKLDGLDPRQFKVNQLKRAVKTARDGSPGAISKANGLLDRALLAYAEALRQAPAGEWIINDREAVPRTRPATDLLAEAVSAPSLEAWIAAMPFMHHDYAGLRRALADAEQRGDRRSADLLRINLQRVRFLPASGRYVLVNTAAQRLYMYENGRVVDWMRVVVGTPKHATPMMAATIKFTALNPYWQVPADLTAERIAPNVVKEGLSYLRRQGYVLLSDWGDGARPVDPSTVNWEAVSAGRVLVRLRQEPGPGNAMGKMKFMFPNPQGIYLHDTPNKELMTEEARLFSGGCVRLEDASRLAKWLHGRPLSWRGARTEQAVPLDRPVPVYLAYLTAVPSGSEVVYYDDIYGKDRSQLAGETKRTIAAR
jgi:murein L,D-transpeptidase YcbB/YkuD